MLARRRCRSVGSARTLRVTAIASSGQTCVRASGQPCVLCDSVRTSKKTGQKASHIFYARAWYRLTLISISNNRLTFTKNSGQNVTLILLNLILTHSDTYESFNWDYDSVWYLILHL